MKAYPAYKRTTTPWLPGIPEHWDLQSFRRVTWEINRKNDDGATRPMLSLSAYRGIEPKEWEYAEQARLQEDSLAYKVVAPDQLVINPMWCINGAVAVSQLDGIVSPAYRVYRLCGGLRPRFADYLFRSHFYIKEYNLHVRGSTTYDRSVGKEAFNRLPVVLPPEQEQDAIVAFLEAKERDIQTFITNKRRMIELLKEQKTALINCAVTRGLNRNTPLKPAGIPWIGKIPTQWQASALRRHWEVMDCKHVTVPFFDEGIPLASVVEVQDFELDLSSAKRTDREHYEMLVAGGRRPKRGDLIYCRNASVGAAAYVNTDEELAMGQDVCLIRSDRHNGRFLNYQLNSWIMEQQLAEILVGATIKRINVAEIKALLVVVPPRNEQDAIVGYLDEAGHGFTQAVANAEREIALMEEYRTALIAAAVTGKVDVRTAA